MRSAVVGFIGVVTLAALSACSISTTGNSITLKTQQEFVDQTHPAVSSGAWSGEAITVSNDGVNPITGEGGIEVTVDPSATVVSAQPIYSARADDQAHKADADASIADAVQTFSVTGGAGSPVSIACHHGAQHGTSGVAASGCKLIKVTVPAGSATTPVSLSVNNGNGDVTLSGGPLVASSLRITQSDSSAGNVTVKEVQPTVGGTVTIVSQFDISLALPSGESVDSFSATGPDDPSSITNTFAQDGATSWGTPGAGAATVSLTAGGVGSISVTSF